MSLTNRSSTFDLQPSRLHQAIQGILLASVLTVSVAANAESTNNTGSVKRSYHISGGSLSQALRQFATNSGLLFSAEAKLTDGKTSAGLDGEYTVEEGFKKLLTGSGLTYTLTGNNSVAIKVADSKSDTVLNLPAVKVTGKAVSDPNDPYNDDYRLPNSSIATKTETPIMETPFSVKAIPKQVLEDQQVIRVDKAVENIAGVIKTGANGLQSDSFTIRGFNTGGAGNTYRNGVIFSQLSSGLSAQREVANFERIEVLKGPASLLYGRAEPGGVINYVTKQPLATPYYSLQQQFGSFDLYRTTADATGPVSSNKSLTYRFNMAYENSNSYRQFSGTDNVFVAPVLKYELSDKTRMTFELEYQHWNNRPSETFPKVGGKFYPFNVNQNFAGPNLNNNQGERILGGFNWSHDFNSDWSLSHTFQANSLNYNNALESTDSAAADGSTARSLYYDNVGGKTYFTSVNLTGKFNTGILKHTSLFGFDYFKSNDHLNETGTDSIPFNVFSPNYASNSLLRQSPLIPANNFLRDTNLSWYGLYYQDQVKLPFNLSALGGVRYDSSENEADVGGSKSPNSQNQRINPRGGVVWQPIPELSLYGSYTENFGANNGFDNRGNSLKPQTAQQWEVGTKTELLDGRFSATLAYYDLAKQNVAVTDPSNRLFKSAIGAAESRGIELDVAGEVLEGWKIIGGYSYMPFAKITSGDARTFSLGATGNRLPMAPENSGSLWNTFEFKSGEFQGLKFGAGVLAAGERQGNPANSYQLPGYATVNLLASYSKKIGKSKVTTQLNIDNLLDKAYYVSNTGNEIIPMSSRSFMGSVRVEF